MSRISEEKSHKNNNNRTGIRNNADHYLSFGIIEIHTSIKFDNIREHPSGDKKNIFVERRIKHLEYSFHSL